MIRRPPRYTRNCSSAASDVYKRQLLGNASITVVSVGAVECYLLNLKFGMLDGVGMRQKLLC